MDVLFDTSFFITKYKILTKLMTSFTLKIKGICIFLYS